MQLTLVCPFYTLEGPDLAGVSFTSRVCPATGPARAVTCGHDGMLCIRSWASCNDHVTSRARLLIAGCMSYCRTPPRHASLGEYYYSTCLSGHHIKHDGDRIEPPTRYPVLGWGGGLEFENSCDTCSRLLVVKLTIWRLATWDLLSMRIGRACHSHLARMPQTGRAGSGSLPLTTFNLPLNYMKYNPALGIEFLSWHQPQMYMKKSPLLLFL